jgi:hypothetical protein
VKTEKTAYVLYNPDKQGFRSSRSNQFSYQKNFDAALLYVKEFHAKRAANKNDTIIPVRLTLDPEDMCVAILKGTPP